MIIFKNPGSKLKINEDLEIYLYGVEEAEIGYHYIFKFDTNWGASIVKKYGTYGYEKDLWELAVIYFTDEYDYSLDYSNPITDDVLGWLSNEEVMDYLYKIKGFDFEPNLEEND